MKKKVAAKRIGKGGSQVKEFVRAARELGCDESEAKFDKALGKIAKAKPSAGKRK